MASDMKGWDVYKNPLWLLHNLYKKYKVIEVPTNAAWVQVLVPTGAVDISPFYIDPYTGAGANSSALAHTGLVYALNSGNIYLWYIDWTKRLELSFTVTRELSNVQAVARFQLKEANAEGILAQRGIGIQIDNYAMTGEAYGTARGTVAIGSLTDGRIKRIKIVLANGVVEFWVDRVLAGTLTGTAVPSVVGTGLSYLVVSIINGAAGGNATLNVGNIQIVQAW